MIKKIDACWICGNNANSSEHRFKKSDLIRQYGNPAEWKHTEPVLFRNGKKFSIQGPNSNLVKYEKNLCHTCNTTISQPWDKAYDLFIDHIYRNEDKILHYRMIDFSEIYGIDNLSKCSDLYKYFVKSFGCRAVYAGMEPDQDLVEIFNLKEYKTKLFLTFSVNEGALSLEKEHRDSFIGRGNFIGHTNLNDKKIKDGIYHENINWLTINYWYGEGFDYGLGSMWIANSRWAYLGCSYYGEETRERISNLFDELKESGISCKD